MSVSVERTVPTFADSVRRREPLQERPHAQPQQQQPAGDADRDADAVPVRTGGDQRRAERHERGHREQQDDRGGQALPMGPHAHHLALPPAPEASRADPCRDDAGRAGISGARATVGSGILAGSAARRPGRGCAECPAVLATELGRTPLSVRGPRRESPTPTATAATRAGSAPTPAGGTAPTRPAPCPAGSPSAGRAGHARTPPREHCPPAHPAGHPPEDRRSSTPSRSPDARPTAPTARCPFPACCRTPPKR